MRWIPRFARRVGADERGFTILEVVAALTVLAVSTMAFATTVGQSLRLVGKSKERQTAVHLANSWMEEVRGVPYDGLGLPDDTLFDGAPTPDEDVTAGAYRGEPLVLLAGSTFRHHDTESINNIDHHVYRYVTWMADGGDVEAYKRVTVVVQWDGTSTSSTPARLELATIVSKGSIGWTSTTSTTAAVSTTTTTSPSTTTTSTPADCGGDATGPAGSISILAGTGADTGYTSSSTVNLDLFADDPCTPISMAFSNGGTWSDDLPYENSKAWQLAPDDGSRTVFVRYRDGAGNESIHQATVRVDGTAPTTPADFAATVKNGPKRVELTWTASTDNDALIGYRIYVKEANGSFQNQPTGVGHPCPTNPCSWTHTGVKTNETYTYTVVAYDAAGNESTRTREEIRSV